MTEQRQPSPFEPEDRHSVLWLSDYVYGTISTLVAIAGLTFETHPEALTTAGVVVFGARGHLAGPYPVAAGDHPVVATPGAQALRRQGSTAGLRGPSSPPPSRPP